MPTTRPGSLQNRAVAWYHRCRVVVVHILEYHPWAGILKPSATNLTLSRAQVSNGDRAGRSDVKRAYYCRYTLKLAKMRFKHHDRSSAILIRLGVEAWLHCFMLVPHVLLTHALSAPTPNQCDPCSHARFVLLAGCINSFRF